jgi:hypothetical protein
VTGTPLALVTGRREQLGAAGAALGRTGFDVTSWEEVTNPLPLPDGPFDCYVQLPCGRTGPPARAAADLVCRVDALAAVAGRLRPMASVLLGVEEVEPSTAPERVLAPDLLAAVALALLEDLGRPEARVAVLSVADLCRALVELPVGGDQWEIPTPPLVSAP